MTAIETLRSDVEVVAFDVYDTLLDREAVLVPTLADLLAGVGLEADPAVFLRRYLAMHFRDSLIDSLLPGPHTPFKEISRRALTYRLEQAGVEPDDEAVRGFVREWDDLPPYSDVDEALATLSESYMLVGLSNGDPDMLTAVSSNFGVDLDELVSVAKAGAYKPHPAPYRWVLDRLDLAAHEVLFVTAHTFDLVGAKAVGMRGGYLDRHNNPVGGWPHRPDLRVDTTSGLAEILS